MSGLFYAYYFALLSTGSDAVDAILKEVANAGKGCHNTNGWSEYGYPLKIQNAADSAATAIQALEARSVKSEEDLAIVTRERNDAARLAETLGRNSADLVDEVTKAKQESAALKEDARRYRRLRVLGCAPAGTKQLEAATVLRFTNLDGFVDSELDAIRAVFP